jgi:hypothetical protein
MKKSIIKIAVLSFLICSPFFVSLSFADAPPDPGGGPGGGDGPVGGGSPIGGGLTILFALGAAYSGKKIFNARKKLLE